MFLAYPFTRDSFGLEASIFRFITKMEINEKGAVGISTDRKGEGKVMNTDEMRLAEMGTKYR